ncbi:MAG: PQQ-binding-like beta-propeller repeat protein, partial [Lentisphaeria bacterium]|nr:PQQ-binding-like beta-propeller repeat protein [Lentisphaeria bacterium]
MRPFRGLFGVVSGGLLAVSVWAGDWPMVRGDARRGGHTAEALPDGLAVHWSYRARHRPEPAWSGRDTRMPFDRAMHPVVAGGRVFFGSSVDCKVYALDAATGGELWQFFCEGPVRFAPAVAGDRVFVVSDD